MLGSDRPNNDQREVEWRDGDRDRLGSDNEDVLGSRGSAVVENGRLSSSMAANRLFAIELEWRREHLERIVFDSSDAKTADGSQASGERRVGRWYEPYHEGETFKRTTGLINPNARCQHQ